MVGRLSLDGTHVMRPLALVVCAMVLCVGARSAAAQEATDAEGAADFRTAPRLAPGRYTDTVVAGESVWYAVLYTNEVPYRLNAALRGAAPEGSEFSIEFLSPTLEVLDSAADTLTGSATYSAGGTNTWYVRVNLASPTEVGETYEFDIELDGVNEGRLEPCEQLPDCEAADQMQAKTAEVDEANAELSELTEDGSGEAVKTEIDALKKRVPELQAELEPQRTTPVALILLLVVTGGFAAAGGLIVRTRGQRKAPPTSPQ